MSLYIESADRPNRSGVANEDIHVGELVKHTSNGVERLDGSESQEDFVGVADDPKSGDQIAEDDETVANSFVYESANNDIVSYGGDEDGAVIKVFTVETGGADPTTPSISDGNVVGVPNTGVAADEGRVVEEGYTDNAVTYNRSNGNFVPIGIADRDGASSLDVPVRVEVRKDL